MKAMSNVRRYRNEDGVASKCSAGSFVPRNKPTAGGAAEDRSASNAPPPKSDAQKSRDASEPLFAKKKPTSGKEHRKRDPSPPLDEDDSSGVEEDDDGSSSKDAKGYDRERRQFNEDRRRWQENAQRDPPRDGREMTWRSRLEGVEEELAKETEEDSHHYHPEEMQINLVVITDRRVSLMVTLPGLRLLMFFPRSPNVLKSRRDHLLHRFRFLKIPIRIFPASVPTCGLTLRIFTPPHQRECAL